MRNSLLTVATASVAVLGGGALVAVFEAQEAAADASRARAEALAALRLDRADTARFRAAAAANDAARLEAARRMRALAKGAAHEGARMDALLARARRRYVRVIPGPVHRVVTVTAGGAAPAAATTRTS
jgi:hypothetical protein